MMTITNPKVGFVGLGRMGANMARRLHDCGLQVAAVYDVNFNVSDVLAKELQTVAATSLAAVTAACDVILTVVTDDAAMRGIFTTEGDNLLIGAQGRVFINCATVSPALHLEVNEEVQKAGASAVEACMSGSITQAREGSIYLMIGGDEKLFKALAPVLDKLGSQVRYVGQTGQAAKVKALVNMVMNINTAGLAEGLGLADALGLDLSTIRKVFSETGAASRVLVTDGEDMQNRDHTCFFSAAHAAKDSGIALQLAHQQGLHLPLAEATKEQYDRMILEGLGELDKSGIAELTFRNRGGA